VVEKSFLIPTKGQAYVQLPDIPSATNLINFYQTRDANIRGKKISFEFSSHQEITPVPSDSTPTTLPPPSVSSSSIPAASLPSTASTKPLSSHDQSILGHGHGHGHPPGGQGGGPPPVNAILMVSVSKIEYDMTVDVLYQVFQKFGNVQKIITFWKNEEFKALIQMETMDQAQAVQSALNGRDIYTGCNTLHICFSRHTELKVKFNNERSWDYMNPNLPAGPPMASGQQQYGGEEDDYGILPPTPPSYQPQPLPSRTSGYRGMEDQQTGGRYGDGGGSNRYEDIGGSGGGSGGGPRRGASGRDDYRDQRDRGGGRSSHAQRRRSPVIICSNLDQRIIGVSYFISI
jgi:hnRNP-L/PTB/hephaestus splicing factor